MYLHIHTCMYPTLQPQGQLLTFKTWAAGGAEGHARGRGDVQTRPLRSIPAKESIDCFRATKVSTQMDHTSKSKAFL